MLISLPEILSKYKIKPKGVIHCGAHWAEEFSDYQKAGIWNMVFIEPCTPAFNKMVDTVGFVDGVTFFKCACADEEGDGEMNVSHNNQGQSNSLLKPKLHLEQHRDVVFTDHEIVRVRKLDNLEFDKSKYDFLVMDCQGTEGLVLKGATETLENINLVYTEVNRGETYEGNALIEEIDAMLLQYDLIRVETYWPSPNWTWGDAAFVKRSFL